MHCRSMEVEKYIYFSTSMVDRVSHGVRVQRFGLLSNYYEIWLVETRVEREYSVLINCLCPWCVKEDKRKLESSLARKVSF